jgi:hypothetical protein
MIPEFNEHGFLPEGVHDCGLSEIETRFAYNERRREIWEKFSTYLKQLKTFISDLRIVYVDGSFTTDCVEPQDIDVVVEVDSPVDEARIRAQLGQMVDRSFVKNSFKTDLLWAYRNNPNADKDFRNFFQKMRIRETSRLGIAPDTKKGILRVNS